LWTFLAKAPRLEILYHSIHYFDLIRSWLGTPRSVSAKTVKSPLSAGLAATKTVAILDYGDSVRVFVATNHSHDFGPAHQNSFVQWEGHAGAARMTMGVISTIQRENPTPWSILDAVRVTPHGHPFPSAGTTFRMALWEQWALCRPMQKDLLLCFQPISKTPTNDGAG
jgi:predicted dehydrogenase